MKNYTVMIAGNVLVLLGIVGCIAGVYSGSYSEGWIWPVGFFNGMAFMVVVRNLADVAEATTRPPR